MSKFNKGDKVIINSINTKGIISYIRYPLHNEPQPIYYIVDYTNGSGDECSTGFKSEHIRLDKEWYRNQKIARTFHTDNNEDE